MGIKAVFADLPMTEDCKILSLHVQRRFKTEEDKVQPAEYLPVIKALFSNSAGSIEIKDAVAFLDKNLARNTADVTFDLKYICNFIEFKERSKNSKSYLVSTCGLPAEERLLEANVITSLSRAFGVSAQVAAAIYHRIAKGGAITVSNLALEIDQYRVTPAVEDGKSKTESSKVDVSQTLQKFNQKVGELPKLIQTQTMEKMRAVDKKEN